MTIFHAIADLVEKVARQEPREVYLYGRINHPCGKPNVDAEEIDEDLYQEICEIMKQIHESEKEHRLKAFANGRADVQDAIREALGLDPQ